MKDREREGDPEVMVARTAVKYRAIGIKIVTLTVLSYIYTHGSQRKDDLRVKPENLDSKVINLCH